MDPIPMLLRLAESFVWEFYLEKRVSREQTGLTIRELLNRFEKSSAAAPIFVLE